MMHVPNSAEAARTDDDRVLAERVLAFIEGTSGEDFDDLVLAAHAYQYRRNPPWRRFVDRVGTPPRVWQEIPAVPAVAFRETVLACGPAERIYESSGTTEGPAHRARHYVPDVGLYRAAALAGFRRAVLPEGERRLFLVAAPERATHPASSLGEMVTWLRETHDAGAERSFLVAGALDYERLASTLDRLDPSRPVLVLALTSALLHLADLARERGRAWRLPAGSLIVDTGGCKGYSADLPRAEILARHEAVLGVRREEIVNEYGMTELCSQLYARGLEPFVGPPWLRTVVCDPETGDEQAAGTTGLLRHLDLANLGSVLAIQTEDVGRAVHGGIELLGRAVGAETRGCSLLLAR